MDGRAAHEQCCGAPGPASPVGRRRRGCEQGNDLPRGHGGSQWQCHEGWRSQRILFTTQALLAQPAMHHVRVQTTTQGDTGHRRSTLPGLLQKRRFWIGAVLAPQPALSINQSFHRPHNLLRGDDPRLHPSLQDGWPDVRSGHWAGAFIPSGLEGTSWATLRQPRIESAKKRTPLIHLNHTHIFVTFKSDFDNYN